MDSDGDNGRWVAVANGALRHTGAYRFTMGVSAPGPAIDYFFIVKICKPDRTFYTGMLSSWIMRFRGLKNCLHVGMDSRNRFIFLLSTYRYKKLLFARIVIILTSFTVEGLLGILATCTPQLFALWEYADNSARSGDVEW